MVADSPDWVVKAEGRIEFLPASLGCVVVEETGGTNGGPAKAGPGGGSVTSPSPVVGVVVGVVSVARPAGMGADGTSGGVWVWYSNPGGVVAVWTPNDVVELNGEMGPVVNGTCDIASEDPVVPNPELVVVDGGSTLVLDSGVPGGDVWVSSLGCVVGPRGSIELVE